MKKFAFLFITCTLFLYGFVVDKARAADDFITLKDYINHIRSEIYGLRAENSAQPLYLAEPMKLELTVGFKSSGNGGVDFYVFSMEGKAEQFHTQKITVSLGLLGEETERVERPDAGKKEFKFAEDKSIFNNKTDQFHASASEYLEDNLDVFASYVESFPEINQEYPIESVILGMLQSGQIENIESADVFDSFGNRIGRVVGVDYQPEASWKFSDNATLLIEPSNWSAKAQILARPGSWTRESGRIELVEDLSNGLTSR